MKMITDDKLKELLLDAFRRGFEAGEDNDTAHNQDTYRAHALHFQVNTLPVMLESASVHEEPTR